jgi:hypothetical protein
VQRASTTRAIDLVGRRGIDVGGGAGNTQYDPASGHVLAAVHGRSYLADIDPAALKVAARIALRDVDSCHGLGSKSTLSCSTLTWPM